MKTHATDYVLSPERTMCGRPITRIDNANPTCGVCLKAIHARCSNHNLKGCRLCGPDGGIKTGTKYDDPRVN